MFCGNALNKGWPRYRKSLHTIEHHDVEHLISYVVNGAYKTFAILVLIRYPKKIKRFVERRDTSEYLIDTRLPLSRDNSSRVGL